MVILSRKPRLALGVVPGLMLSGLLATPAAAAGDGGAVIMSCPPPGDATIYDFSSYTASSRPTNLYSAYITGPGTLTYNKTSTASVNFTASASVTAEAGVVVAKASSQMGVALTTGKSWTDGFSYSLSVPAGQTRRMRLYQESRSMLVTKRSWNSGTCKYVSIYSNQFANAPRTARIDIWKLEAP